MICHLFHENSMRISGIYPVQQEEPSPLEFISIEGHFVSRRPGFVTWRVGLV